MIKKIILGLLALLVLVVAGFCAVVAVQPADFKIVRTTTIAAPPEKVFEHVNDFNKWDNWSPWAKIDPTMKKEISGAPSGKGAIYYWNGNDEVGEGRMTITESHPSSHVKIDLEFMKPMEQKNITEFALKPEGDKTNVTWTMTGQNNFVGKAFWMLMNVDKMVGADFEKGLAQMKTVAEAR